VWNVLLHPNVVKFLNRLDNNMRERIKEKLLELEQDPFRFLEHYEGAYYKFRVGDFRALIDVDFERKEIMVRSLDHRKKIYKMAY